MFAAWSVCAILFASVFGARAAPLEEDPLIEKVKEIIADVDKYIASHNLTEIRVPDIQYPLNIVKIKNGGFGDFSTIELQDGSSVEKRDYSENTTGYRFDIKLGLQNLRFHYDFEVDTHIFKRVGNFSLAVQDNSAELFGFAIVESGKSCKAYLATSKVIRYGKYKIDVQPNDFPELTFVTENILNFVTPYLLPLTNAELKAALLAPKLQYKFSEFVCKRIATL